MRQHPDTNFDAFAARRIAWYVVVDDESFDRSEELLGFYERQAEAEAFAAGLRMAGVEHVGVYSFDMDAVFIEL